MFQTEAVRQTRDGWPDGLDWGGEEFRSDLKNHPHPPPRAREPQSFQIWLQVVHQAYVGTHPGLGCWFVFEMRYPSELHGENVSHHLHRGR